MGAVKCTVMTHVKKKIKQRKEKGKRGEKEQKRAQAGWMPCASCKKATWSSDGSSKNCASCAYDARKEQAREKKQTLPGAEELVFQNTPRPDSYAALQQPPAGIPSAQLEPCKSRVVTKHSHTRYKGVEKNDAGAMLDMTECDGCGERETRFILNMN